MKKIFFLTIIFFISTTTFGQHIGSTYKDAMNQGIKIQYLDSNYKSAVGSDTTGTIFTTDSIQKLMTQAFTNMLQDFASFLYNNNLRWDKPIKTYNKVYFNSDGTIDYFLYNFFRNLKPEDQLSAVNQIEFNRLLNLFIKDYKFPLTSKTKFSQCGSTTYMPKENTDNKDK